MKITHCIFSMLTGGAQVLVVEMLNQLSDSHTVSLIVVNEEVNSALISRIDKKVKIYYIKRGVGSKNPLYLLKLNLLLKKLKPDVVHCHETNMANFLVFKSFKSILTVHGVNKRVDNFNKYDAVIAISKAVAIDFKRLNQKDIPIIHNGIQLSTFERRKKYEFSTADTFKIVQVSRLMHATKGQDILLQAIQILINNNKHKNIEVDFVGDGDSLEFLQNMVHSLGLDQYVSFLGDKDRTWIEKNLAKYNLLVQPSRDEGFGLTILESIAAGLPVVASNIEGPAEIFENCEVKFLFETGNPNDCAAQILKTIDLYASLKMQNIANDTFNAVSKLYSSEHMTNSYLELYKELIK